MSIDAVKKRRNETFWFYSFDSSLIFSFQAAYDKILKARAAAEARHQVLDSKRKKFKEGEQDARTSRF